MKKQLAIAMSGLLAFFGMTGCGKTTTETKDVEKTYGAYSKVWTASDPSNGDPGKGGSPGNTNMRSDVINENYESVDYREIYQKYYDQIKQELASGNLTPEQRAFYEKYFETLK